MYCKNCGGPIKEGQEICDRCIERMNRKEMTKNEEKEKVVQEEVKKDITVEESRKEENIEQPKVETYNTKNPTLKSKTAGGLFGIFLGAFGVHNFYLGYMTKAIIQVSVSSVAMLLFCCTFFVPFLIFIPLFTLIGMEIWGLIEGILILSGSINTDGKGNPLGD